MMIQKSGTGWNGHCYAQNQETAFFIHNSEFIFLTLKNAQRLANPIQNVLTLAGHLAYRFTVAAKSATRFDSLNVQADDRFSFMRFFYVRKPSYAQIMVGRNGGAFGFTGFLYAGLSTLLRLTTPIDSGVVGFSNPYKRPPLWLLPQPRFTLISPFSFWRSAAQLRTKNRTVKPLLPQMSDLLANVLNLILFCSLLAAFPFRRCAMFDNTPLEQEELIDQCRALAYAIVELREPQAKEILMFILAERLDALHRAQEDEAA
ncbi:hypothetical protein [Pectobacterium colocasium]|uniref:hypothetical protein n=1 Tax=Pectobacterium colocasium TaxID=2878098 RepID=UPI003C12B81F